MDEPLSNLDAKLRLQMRTEIKRLHRELPITTVYVTHDQSEAMLLSDRVVVMNRGTVAQVDTPEGIYRRPADLFVAGFVGAPAMNLLPVSLSASGDEIRCTTKSGAVALVARVAGPPAAQQGILGIRPKHVAWKPLSGAAEPGWLRGTVQEVDDTGDDALLHVDLDGEQIRILDTRGGVAAVGDPIAVRFPVEDAHLFVADRRVEFTVGAVSPVA
jgi:ABC-type sugar transport system ATPase subunit